MDNPSLKQAIHLLSLVVDQDVSLGRLQVLYEMGVFSDLLRVEDPRRINRDKLLLALGYDPPVFQVETGAFGSTNLLVATLHTKMGRCEAIDQANFPIRSHDAHRLEFEIFDVGHPFHYAKYVAAVKRRHLRCPTHEEALYFALQWGASLCPNTKRPFVVFPHEPVALGSGKQPNKRILCIHRPTPQCVGSLALQPTAEAYRENNHHMVAAVRI